MKVSMSIQNAYNEWSETYDTDENLTRDLDQKVTREALANLHFHSILEIGCGTGKNTSFLSRIGTSVHAIDFSPGMIEKAKEKVKAKNVKFSMADITEKWNFADLHSILLSAILYWNTYKTFRSYAQKLLELCGRKDGFSLDLLHKCAIIGRCDTKRSNT